MKREARSRSTGRVGWKTRLDEKLYSSVIAKRFRQLINWLYSLLINGFFGKLFTAYSAEEQRFFNSGLYRVLGGGKKVRRVTSGVRARMAKAFENSRILTALDDLVASLIHRKLKTYGAFLVSLGAYGIVTYIVRVYVLVAGEADLSAIMTCLLFVVLALPLMTSRETFATAAGKSRMMSALLFGWLGIPRDSFAAERSYPKRYTLVTALGMILGALTYFIHPIYYVQFALLLLAGALVFSYPEIGVLGLVALVPLSALFRHPSIVLFAAVAVTVAGYLIKIMRGKRVAKLRLVDAAVLVFAIILLLGGVFSAGGVESFAAAALYFTLIMAYFLTVNLIRSREWVRRVIITLLVFAGISAVIGVVQVFTGSMESSWLDTEMFSDIRVRITSTFDNPNTYASYLLLVIPFVPAMMLRKDAPVRKFPLAACLILLVGCLVETWCRGAWLGILVAAVIFMLVYSRRSVPYLLAGGALLPLVTWVLPDNLISRFASIGSASDSSTVYRISAWRGVGRMLRENWLGGIGVGESAFSAVYPAFSYAGIEGIRHTHNLYLQILSETGIAGLVMFVAVLILFVQNCFEYIYKMRNRGDTSVVIAGLVAVIALLVMGLTDYIWYSYRVFLLFWMIIGLVNAQIRIGLAELGRTNHFETNSLYSVNFDMNVDNL